MERLEAVVIGAGHAGLAASQRLSAARIEHVVLERGRVGESWRSQRWDTFRLNTPSWMNRLPGDDEADIPQPTDAFQSATAFADRLAAYATRWRLPVREGAAVTAVEADGAGCLVVEVGGRGGDRLAARSVVVASGIQNEPRLPEIARALPARLTALHALDYRDPASLPPGAVLVVGAGQTGGQISEDLLGAGRRVYLSPSRVPRLRRRHRGRDALEWLVPGGFWEVTPEQLPDPAWLRLRQPLTSGLGRHGHTISLQSLAARGVTLVGRIRSVEGNALLMDDTVADCIRFGDEWSARLRALVDRMIEASGIPLPPMEDDPVDEPHPDPGSVRSPERLDLDRLDIRTVIWATGVGGRFDWLPPGVLGDDGTPEHRMGATGLPGLFVLGFPWLVRRGSGIIHGVDADSRRIVDAVIARAG